MITIRPLSILERQQARHVKEQEAQAEAFALMDKLGDVKAALADISDADIASARQEARAAQNADETDPENYDTAYVLRAGIVAWDYATPDGSPYPCDDETKVSLDPASGEWVLREILKLSGRTAGEG